MSPRAASLAPALAALVVLSACGGEPTPEPLPPWHEADGHRWRELDVGGDGEGFTPLEAGRTGLDIPYEIPEDRLVENELLADGSGAAVGDVDGDGRPDVYVSRVVGENGLFLNRGGMRFVEATDEAGVALEDHRSTGVVLEDVDGDGDLDLLVGGLGDADRLLLNDGSGHFTDATSRSGLAGEDLGTTTLALADVDGDGRPDLYTGSYKTRKAVDIFPPEERTPERILMRQGDSVVVAPRYRDHYEFLRSDGELKRWELAEPDRFYRNRGDGRFEPVSFTGGDFLDHRGEPLQETPRDWALSARFQDLDGDGDQDLYVCNDFESPDHVWMNWGDGTFRQVEPLSLRATSASCMAVDFTDLDGDGGTEIFSSDMDFREGPGRRLRVRGTYPERPRSDSTATVVQENYNTLQWRRADGTWSEVARHAGVSSTGWTWGVSFLDVDLDGREDLLTVTGNVWDFLDPDAQRRIGGGPDEPIPSRERLAEMNRLPSRNAAFRARPDDLRFEEKSRAWSFGTGEDIAHALVPGDLDGDGDLDLLVTRWDRSPVIYRNEATAPRVAVRLLGRPPNTSATGATVTLRGGPRAIQSRQVESGGLYLSDAGPTLSFAAGEAEALALSVRWPGGACSELRVRPGRLYEVEPPPLEAESGAEECPAAGAGAGRPEGVEAPSPLFEDRTADLGHRHTDRSFGDFQRQPLVPYGLSELGPGVSWQDLDGDGGPELVVGAGRGGELAVFGSADGELRRWEAGLGPAEQDQTTALALPDGDGGTDLLVGAFGYETSSPSEAAELPAARRIEWQGQQGRTTPEVPGERSAAGPLALADVDGDGDLDLFVGHRVYPAAYPIPPSSHLYRNEGGRLVRDEASSATFEGLGLVTSALFTDLGGDGRPDLVVATEWGPIRVFRNEGGTFREETAGWGLEEWTGWWNGLASGDLTGNGRPDLVVTSWGTNTEYGRVAAGTDPLEIYFGLFDDNSSLDVLIARRDPAVEGAAPLRGWEWLGPALPGVAERVEEYADFSRRTVAELLDLPRENVSRAAARELRHLVLLNRGGSFEARPLPVEAQIAPAFGVSVAELDGDGREDVVLAQNFSAVPPGAGPYRAGRSLWLKGDGAGGFESLPDSVSGLWVYGDGRGVATADYDGDGRTDVAVGQHRGPTRLFRNVGAAPGLRVRLRGPPGNPHAVGATVRLVYEDGRRGPAREIRAGSGHWSTDGPVPVLGRGGEPAAVWIRWPGGEVSEVPVPDGAREVSARMPEDVPGGGT